MNDVRVIIDTVKANMEPAKGCTEPGAIAYAAARAAAALRDEAGPVAPDGIRVKLSSNVYKNARSVGIPGMGSSGIDRAAVLGALFGKGDRALEALGDITDSEARSADEYLRRLPPFIEVDDSQATFFIGVEVAGGGRVGRCRIEGNHTNVTYVGVDDRSVYTAEVYTAEGPVPSEKAMSLSSVSIADVLESRRHLNGDDELFFKTAIELNGEAGSEASQNDALEITRALYPQREGQVTGRHPGATDLDAVIRWIKRTTVAAVEARMAGSSRSVITNSGSGNQGLTATLPVVLAAQVIECDERDVIEAVYLSHAINTYLRDRQGVLSAMCGLIGASLGAVCGVLSLVTSARELPDAIRRVSNAMAASVTGMICDGAKASCAYKCAVSLDAAALGYRLVRSGVDRFEGEGVVGSDLDTTIANMGDIATRGLRGVDEVVLAMVR